MIGKFRQQPCAQPLEGMSVIDFNVELSGHLTVDRFHDLADMVEHMSVGRGHLLGLIRARENVELDSLLGTCQ